MPKNKKLGQRKRRLQKQSNQLVENRNTYRPIKPRLDLYPEDSLDTNLEATIYALSTCSKLFLDICRLNGISHTEITDIVANIVASEDERAKDIFDDSVKYIISKIKGNKDE